MMTQYDKINWKQAFDEVKRLQYKLNRAIKDNDSKKIAYEVQKERQVNILQAQAEYVKSQNKVYLTQNEILTSYSARAVSVRKVVTAKGKNTPGVDNLIIKTNEQKQQAIADLKCNWQEYKALPVKRVWIPKPGSTNKRPLGIPTMKDRCVQTLFNLILDVHQEHTAGPRSFGFRVGRNAAQAMTYAHKLTSGAGKRAILKVDIEKAYDNVSHEWVIENLPIHKGVLTQWLKAGVFENGQITKTDKGVPQGGPISATIFNCVLNGIETRIMKQNGNWPIIYADDIMVFAKNESMLENTGAVIDQFLKPRGLNINVEKTEVSSIEKGVDFLGFSLREYVDATRTNNPKMPDKKGVVLTKPADKSIRNFKLNISGIFSKCRNSSAYRLILELNPVIRGWANYFRCSSGWTNAKKSLNHWLYTKCQRWIYAKHSGSKMGKRELKRRYFFSVQRSRTFNDNWAFKATLGKDELLIVNIAEVKVKHQNVLTFDPMPNPFNPDDAVTFDKKLASLVKAELRLTKTKQNLIGKQQGLCLICGQHLDFDLEKLEVDHIIPKAKGGSEDPKNLRLIHRECHKQKTNIERKYWTRKSSVLKSTKKSNKQ